MKTLVENLQSHPRAVAWLGAISGWASFDYLQAAQFIAAILASIVSVCALILTGPTAWATLVDCYRVWKSKH